MQPSPQVAPVPFSPPPDWIERALALLAPHDTPVLFRGEGGSGRGFLARQLHALSPRAGAPFVKVDCRGLSSLPGSTRELLATISTAGKGTVLFEDVDLLCAPLQAVLMAWLEGSLRKVDAPRVLSTSRVELEDEARLGRFREDLRARIEVFEIAVPPLRERPLEIPLLAGQLAQKAARRLGIPPLVLTAEVLALLVEHSWPGNIRELANVMERAVALSSGPTLDAATLQLRPSGRG
jgi:DNA-binding NtrC family response regulator